MRPHRLQPIRLPRPWDSPGKNTGVGCHFLLQCIKVKSEREVAQSRLTLRDPMDCSPPGSSAHGILQARALEWGAIAFSENVLQVESYRVLPFQIGFLHLLISISSWTFLFMTVIHLGEPMRARARELGGKLGEVSDGR